MEKRQLGRSDNFIDVAEMYPVPGRAETQGLTEQYIGTWIEARQNRDKYILATKVTGRSGMTWVRDGKVPMTRHTPEQIDEAVEKSLKRLNRLRIFWARSTAMSKKGIFAKSAFQTNLRGGR